jgi:hypothetical protein
MKLGKLLIVMAAFLAVALFVVALDFNPNGNIDLKSRYNIINGGNITFQRVYVTSAPTACPAGSFLTFWNGTTGLCSTATAASANDTNTVNIKDWGALGNDTTSDRQVFLNIFAAYPSGNIKIFMPCGTYYLDNELVTESSMNNVILEGAGWCSVIKQANGMINHTIKINGGDYWILRDFAIDGNNGGNHAGYDKDGIETAQNSNHLIFENLYIHNTTGSGLNIQGSNDIVVTGLTLQYIGNSKNTSTSAGGHGIELNGVNNARIQGNSVLTYWGDGGIFASNSLSGKTMSNVVIDSNYIKGGMDNQASGIHVYEGYQFVISNNMIDGQNCTANGVNGIFVEDGADTLISGYHVIIGNKINSSGVGIENNEQHTLINGNVIFGPSCIGSDANGIYSEGVAAIISNNLIDGKKKHGIQIAKPLSNYTQISGNTIKNSANNAIDVWVASAGQYMKEVTIQNNVMIDDQAAATQDYPVGFSGSGGVLNFHISDNVYNGNTQGDIQSNIAAGLGNVTFDSPVIFKRGAWPETYTFGAYVSMTSTSTQYDYSDQSKGLGSALIYFPEKSALNFTVRGRLLQDVSDTLVWQLYNENGTQITNISQTLNNTLQYVSTTTKTSNPVGWAYVRVRQYATGTNNDAFYYGATLVVSNG